MSSNDNIPIRVRVDGYIERDEKRLRSVLRRQRKIHAEIKELRKILPMLDLEKGELRNDITHHLAFLLKIS